MVCRKSANGGFRIRMRYGEICIFMTSYIFFSILTAIGFVLSNLQVQRVKTTILANVALCRGVIPLLFSCYSLRSGSGTRGPLFASCLAQPPGWEICIIEPIVTKIGSFQDQYLLRKREMGPGIILTLSRISSPAPVFGSKISDPYRKSLV